MKGGGVRLWVVCETMPWGRGEGRGVEGQGGGRSELGEKKKRRNKKETKKIIEDISQAEAGLLRHTMLIKE